MYDIRQFKPAMYLLLFLGISGFAIAAQSAGLWLLGAGVMLPNAALAARGRFRPAPRLLANLATLAGFVYVIREMALWGMNVMVVGDFLVFLQLVKLWEQRSNRDWAQLLVLSLLLMVAASMNTASLWFGLLLLAYLFLSLYCCLLFHLKVETDAAKAAIPVPVEKISPAALRQDQRYLGRSMRRLTAVVSFVAISLAILVFLAFPRGGGGMISPMRPPTGAALTGFSDRVRFQDVTRILQSHEKVAFVKVWRNGRLVAGTEPLLLRGLTLDRYLQMGDGGWEWSHMPQWNTPDFAAGPDEPLNFPATGSEEWRQQITLFPSQTKVLFALPGLKQFTPRIAMRVTYSLGDGSLEVAGRSLLDRVDYEAISTNQPGRGSLLQGHAVPASEIQRRFPRIYDFARKPEVSGVDATGRSLAEQRITQGDASPLDASIAANIERYLQTQFTYTLDLSDETRDPNINPLEEFLYVWKRGHCEYFAGAMTLMCQSLGMRARMVVGFQCGPENYNDYSQSYTVYDSDAHAWVEVKTLDGWQTFNPTAFRDAPAAAGKGLLGRLRHLIEYLEFGYANAVIAYDAKNRENLLDGLETRLSEASMQTPGVLSRLRNFVTSILLSYGISLALALTVMVAALGVLAWLVGQRWRLRRRAHRIGIESLPADQQLRLARQLGFYDELMRLLNRHRIARPLYHTPLEFSRSLTFLPSDVYDTIGRLTMLFYHVRYGGAELTPPRQRRLANVLARLANDLAAALQGRRLHERDYSFNR